MADFPITTLVEVPLLNSSHDRFVEPAWLGYRVRAINNGQYQRFLARLHDGQILHIPMTDNTFFTLGPQPGRISFFNLDPSVDEMPDIWFDLPNNEFVRAFVRVIIGYIGETTSVQCHPMNEPIQYRFLRQGLPRPVALSAQLRTILPRFQHTQGQVLQGAVTPLVPMLLYQTIRLATRSIRRQCASHQIAPGLHDSRNAVEKVSRFVALTIAHSTNRPVYACFTYPFNKPHFFDLPLLEDIQAYNQNTIVPGVEDVCQRAVNEWPGLQEFYGNADVMAQAQLTGGQVRPVWCAVFRHPGETAPPIELALIMLPGDFLSTTNRDISVIRTIGVRFPFVNAHRALIYSVAKTDAVVFTVPQTRGAGRWMRVTAISGIEADGVTRWALMIPLL